MKLSTADSTGVRQYDNDYGAYKVVVFLDNWLNYTGALQTLIYKATFLGSHNVIDE